MKKVFDIQRKFRFTVYVLLVVSLVMTGFSGWVFTSSLRLVERSREKIYVRITSYNVCYTKLLRLDMSKFRNKFDGISETLGLSEFQKEQILSINKNLPTGRKLKEVFIGLGSHSQVYALEVSRPEYYCYTSEQGEKELIRTKLAKSSSTSFLEIVITSYSIHYTKLYDIRIGFGSGDDDE